MNASELVQHAPDFDFGDGFQAWAFPDLKPYQIRAWLLRCPGYYPPELWQHFSASVISLADVEGVPTAHRLHLEAEYELNVYCATPEKDEIHQPAEICLQFGGLGVGAQLARLVADWLMVTALMRVLPPIVDVHRAWNRQITSIVEAAGGHVWLPAGRGGGD